MRNMIMEQLISRVTAETGRPPYFGGAGTGWLPALYEAGGRWRAAVCVDDPASPVAAWLREHTKAELYFFAKPTDGPLRLPSLRPQGPWDSGTVPMVVGEGERDILGVGSIAFGFGTRPELYRERLLDALLGETSGVGFIHVGSLRGAAAVIRGARRLLAGSAPVIQIVRDTPAGDGNGLSELLAIAERLSEAGYELHDSTLSPCRTPDELRRTLDGWYESVFFGFPAGYDVGKLIQLCWDDLTGYRRSSKPGTCVSAGEIVECTGLYPAESWEDLAWRWTGPRPRAGVRLPVARPGRYRLRCRLLKVADDRVLDTLRLFVNGKAVEHETQVNDHDIVLEASVALSVARFSPTAEILFVHADTYFVNPEDPRRLGLALMEVELERQE